MNDQLVLSQVTSAAMVVFLLQWVKKSKYFPWVTAETDKLNRFVGWLMAAVAAVGIHAEFDSKAHTLVISGLALTTIAHGAWDWMHAVVMQELIYGGVQLKDNIKPPAAPAAPAKP